ncbi:hypothetical protein [Streptomyces paradoxus]|uniref:hypothetical protein n=1 Tax=Streptomyces paradoxus TaxID=66375 RepID=UPI0037CE8CB0
MNAIRAGVTQHVESPEIHPDGPRPLIEDAPSRNDLFTALAGPAGRTGRPGVPRTGESALSRSLLEPFASSRS